LDDLGALLNVFRVFWVLVALVSAKGAAKMDQNGPKGEKRARKALQKPQKK
jgi:hypothetical protein